MTHNYASSHKNAILFLAKQGKNVTRAFNHILLMGRHGIPGVPETLKALAEYLPTMVKNVWIEKASADITKEHALSTVSIDKLPSETDLIIVVGGDGSLIHSARHAIEYDLPVLGINHGRLGFLTDIRPDELHKVAEVIQGQYHEERRFLLEFEVTHNDKLLCKNIALNEVVLLPGNVAHLIEFEIHVNNQFVCMQRADGMIVATPTGSTAYALSGGGPILHPKLNAIVMVPMFPHTLSSRPLVVAGDSDIKILVNESNISSPCINYDGQERTEIAPGSKIHIIKRTKQLRLIHPQDYNYYTTLREKLHWERHANPHPSS